MLTLTLYLSGWVGFALHLWTPWDLAFKKGLIVGVLWECSFVPIPVPVVVLHMTYTNIYRKLGDSACALVWYHCTAWHRFQELTFPTPCFSADPRVTLGFLAECGAYSDFWLVLILIYPSLSHTLRLNQCIVFARHHKLQFICRTDLGASRSLEEWLGTDCIGIGLKITGVYPALVIWSGCSAAYWLLRSMLVLQRCIVELLSPGDVSVETNKTRMDPSSHFWES